MSRDISDKFMPEHLFCILHTQLHVITISSLIITGYIFNIKSQKRLTKHIIVGHLKFDLHNITNKHLGNLIKLWEMSVLNVDATYELIYSEEFS